METRLRAILVDDERLARKDLRSLLAGHEDIEVIGEAGDIGTAIDEIRRGDPDLVFLDVQMGPESGFDLLERIDLRARVVFVTAYDEYAIRAFDVGAVDYLLKPVNPDRLRATIDRVKNSNPAPFAPSRPCEYDDALLLPVNSHLKFLRVNTVVCIRSAGDYSEVITNDQRKGLVLKSMAEWEERLPAKYFCRIHRSTIVNMEYVTKLEEAPGNAYRVFLSGIETPVAMSRRYAALLKHKRG